MAETATAEPEVGTQTASEIAAAQPERGATPTPTEAQLTRLFGPDPDTGAEKPEPEKAEPPAKEEEPKEEEHPKREEGAQDVERDSIVQRLITSGVPAGVIKNASWADLVKWDKVAAKREADIQIAFQERSDLKKRVDELSKTATVKPSEPSSGVPTEAADLRDIYSSVSEILGSDLEKPLASFTEKLLAKAIERIEAKYADTIGELSGSSAATQEMLVEQARASLTESIPELADDTAFYDKVVPKMSTLAKTGAYAEMPTVRARVRALIEDASGLVFKTAKKADATDKTGISRARDNGQPIVRSTNVPSKPVSEEERARRKFMAREEGATDDEVAHIR